MSRACRLRIPRWLDRRRLPNPLCPVRSLVKQRTPTLFLVDRPGPMFLFCSYGVKRLGHLRNQIRTLGRRGCEYRPKFSQCDKISADLLTPPTAQRSRTGSILALAGRGRFSFLGASRRAWRHSGRQIRTPLERTCASYQRIESRFEEQGHV
jgi:hypothetical protein